MERESGGDGGNGDSATPVVHQPLPHDKTRAPAGTTTTQSAPPTRLQALQDVSELIVKQQASYLEATLQVDTPNRYNVFNASSGDRLYYAGETKSDGVCCGGIDKPFKVALIDINNRRVILDIDKPCSASLYFSRCGFCCCGSLGGKLIVKLGNGDLLGEIVHSSFPICCKPSYSIYDENGTRVMTFGGPYCGDCCYLSCGMWAKSEFVVRGADGGEIGKIYKAYRGFVQEMLTNADTYYVQFPKELNSSWKALLLAAVFFIDNMYYESRTCRPASSLLA